MIDFKKINSKNDIVFTAPWTEAAKFNSKNRIVDEDGNYVSANYADKKYRLIAKKERKITAIERIGRGILGFICTIATVGIALLLSKTVKNLFMAEKIKMRYGILMKNSAVFSSSAKDSATPKVSKLVRNTMQATTEATEVRSTDKKQKQTSAYSEENYKYLKKNIEKFIDDLRANSKTYTDNPEGDIDDKHYSESIDRSTKFIAMRDATIVSYNEEIKTENDPEKLKKLQADLAEAEQSKLFFIKRKKTQEKSYNEAKQRAKTEALTMHNLLKDSILQSISNFITLNVITNRVSKESADNILKLYLTEFPELQKTIDAQHDE